MDRERTGGVRSRQTGAIAALPVRRFCLVSAPVSTPLAKVPLVVFDIDGTLLATDAFWLDVGRRSVAAVYARHGVSRALPEDSRFLDAIGLPMDMFWDHVLPAELRHLGAEVETEAESLEEGAFASGLGALYPGARRLLESLHASGRRIALASNCSRRYLHAFIDAFALAPLLSAAKCADDPGIRSKADMLAEIFAETGTRDAVMVGDRDSDRHGALAHRIPFVLFTGGFAGTAPANGDHVAPDYATLRRMLGEDGNAPDES